METVDFLKYQKQLDRIENGLNAQKNVLNFDEACRFTGLSRSTLYKLSSAQKVPHSKPFGKLVYFNRGELETWLLQNPIKTIDELNNEAQSYCTKKGGLK
jgi:excisionase family DNA binding protein